MGKSVKQINRHMNINLVAERTFNLLKGFGYEVSCFDKQGDLVIDPMEATRFAVETPNILVRIDPTDKYLSLKTGTPGESIEKLRPMLKELAQKSMLDFDYSVFDKQIKPKGEKVDVAKQKKEEINMSEDMNELRKLAGLGEEEVQEGLPQENHTLTTNFSGWNWATSIKDGASAEETYASFIAAVKAGPGSAPAMGGGIKPTKAWADLDTNPQKQQELNDVFGTALYKNGWVINPASGKVENSAKVDGNQYQNFANNRDNPIESVTEASLGKMTGSRKSSYQPLTDSVKIIVRHNKDVNEEVRGARSRNIHSILIQRGEEKFKMAENNLGAARAMARHLHNGGETFDAIGESITEMSREFKKLKEFVRYVNNAKLVNETNQEFVTLAMENIDNIKSTFKKLSGVKSYATAIESVSDYNNVELLQDDIDLESKFTETHFDDKVANAMDSLKAMASRKQSFESKITNAIALESFEGVKDLLKETDLMEFETVSQQLGHKVSSLGYSAKDQTLGNYLHSISSKLNAGGQLSQFEYGAIKSSLLSAGQHNVQSVPMTPTESYEAFLDRFVD